MRPIEFLKLDTAAKFLKLNAPAKNFKIKWVQLNF